jgi:hypothetical protein
VKRPQASSARLEEESFKWLVALFDACVAARPFRQPRRTPSHDFAGRAGTLRSLIPRARPPCTPFSVLLVSLLDRSLAVTVARAGNMWTAGQCRPTLAAFECVRHYFTALNAAQGLLRVVRRQLDRGVRAPINARRRTKRTSWCLWPRPRRAWASGTCTAWTRCGTSPPLCRPQRWRSRPSPCSSRSTGAPAAKSSPRS